MKKLLAVAVSAALMTSCLAQTAEQYESFLQKQTVLAVANANAKQAASEADKSKAAATSALASKMDSKDALIFAIVDRAFGAITALQQSNGIAFQQQIAVQTLTPPPQPLPECGFGCQFVKGAGRTFDFLLQAGAAASPIIATLSQAATQRAQLASSERISLGAQAAQTAQFNILGSNMNSLGTAGINGVAGTAAAGFAGMTTVSVAGINGGVQIADPGFRNMNQFGVRAVDALGNPALRATTINGSGNALVQNGGVATVKGDNTDNITCSAQASAAAAAAQAAAAAAAAASAASGGNAAAQAAAAQAAAAAAGGLTGPVSCSKI
jgi:hypothetical protein